MRRHLALKAFIALAVFAGLAFLFLKTVRDTGSEPYTVRREHLRGWAVALVGTEGGQSALVVLRPPPDLPTSVSQQIFRRTMESMVTPANLGIPLVLRNEFDRALAGRVSPSELVALGEEVGLASATVDPICVAARPMTGGSERSQIFFLLFKVPGFERFRQEIARLLDARGGEGSAFNPETLSPILVVAATDRNYEEWLPPGADPERECLAPVQLQ